MTLNNPFNQNSLVSWKKEFTLIHPSIFIPKVSLILLFSICLILTACGEENKEQGNRDKTVTFFDEPKKGVLPFFRGNDFEPFWPKEGNAPYGARKVDYFTFINQNDESFGRDNLKNKIVVVSFFFARCHGICPNIVRNLKLIQSEYGKDANIQIVSFSVTPDLDTPAELRKFALEKGIQDSKWALITGERDKIFELARNTFQADTDAATKKIEGKDFVHSERVYLIDKNLNFRGIYNGNKIDSIQTLIEEIKILEKEG